MAQAEKYAAWIVANKDKKGTPEFDTVSKAYLAAKQEAAPAPQEALPALNLPETVKNPTRGERVAGTTTARAALGLAAIPTAVAQAGTYIGDFLSDKLGISGSLGKTKYVNMANVPKEQHEAIIANNMRGLEEPAFNFNQSVKDLETAKRRGMSYYSGNPVGEDWDVAGGLGTVGGGVLALKAAALPEAATKIGRYLQGGGAGGALSALMPDTQADNPEEYASNMADRAKLGVAFGAAFPMATDLTVGGYNIAKSSAGALSDTFKNFSAKGQQQLAEKHIRELAGYGNTEKTLAALKSAGGLTGKPTSAEAIAQANIGSSERFGGPLVRLEHELARLPETTSKLKSIEVSQEAARLAKLGIISGTDAQQVAAKAAVAKAGQAYEAIKANPVQSNKTLEWMKNTSAFKEAEAKAAKISENMNAAALVDGKAPIPFKIMANVVDKNGKVQTKTVIVDSKVLGPNGKPIKQSIQVPIQTEQYSAQGLQHIKQVLDEFAETPTIKSSTGILGTEGVGYKALSKSLVGWMDNNIAGWTPARENYKLAMNTLNRQSGGKVLQDTLSGPRGEERVASFLQAQRDLPKTLKPVSGKIRPIPFTPSEQGIIDDVATQLRRDAQVTRMAGELNIPGATSPVTGNMAQLPSPLYRPTMIANWILRRGGDEGNRAVNRIAADILADPTKAAAVLGKLPSPTRKAVMDVMTRLGKGAYTTGFVGATTLPAKDAQEWLPD